MTEELGRTGRVRGATWSGGTLTSPRPRFAHVGALAKGPLGRGLCRRGAG
jgi:hypothetical protein